MQGCLGRFTFWCISNLSRSVSASSNKRSNDHEPLPSVVSEVAGVSRGFTSCFTSCLTISSLTRVDNLVGRCNTIDQSLILIVTHIHTVDNFRRGFFIVRASGDGTNSGVDIGDDRAERLDRVDVGLILLESLDGLGMEDTDVILELRLENTSKQTRLIMNKTKHTIQWTHQSTSRRRLSTSSRRRRICWQVVSSVEIRPSIWIRAMSSESSCWSWARVRGMMLRREEEKRELVKTPWDPSPV